MSEITKIFGDDLIREDLMSSRLFNCLRDEFLEVPTNNQVASMVGDELMKIPNFGKKCLEELKLYLILNGFTPVLFKTRKNLWCNLYKDKSSYTGYTAGDLFFNYFQAKNSLSNECIKEYITTFKINIED